MCTPSHPGPTQATLLPSGEIATCLKVRTAKRESRAASMDDAWAAQKVGAVAIQSITASDKRNRKGMNCLRREKMVVTHKNNGEDAPSTSINATRRVADQNSSRQDVKPQRKGKEKSSAFFASFAPWGETGFFVYLATVPRWTTTLQSRIFRVASKTEAASWIRRIAMRTMSHAKRGSPN